VTEPPTSYSQEYKYFMQLGLPQGIIYVTVDDSHCIASGIKMIVKSADDKSSVLAALEALHACGDGKQQKYIEEELRMMRSGIKGEQESAYHIDFDFGDSDITAVIHDLRLVWDGRVAQIDHLIIHRTHKFYVLETKSFSHGLKITDEGEFLRWNEWKKNFEGMPSPIEQNRRHVEVLRSVLERLGYAKPEIESFVLISPSARIDRSRKYPCPEVVKSDQFTTAFTKRFLDSVSSVGGILGGLSKALFGDPAEVIAKKLVAMHKPIAIDYATKFGFSVISPAAPLVGLGVPASHAAGSAATIPVGATPIRTSSESSVPCCKSCGSGQLQIEYGKYGYYFKCRSCAANTALKLDCGHAGHKEKIRKSKLVFYRECEQCGTSSIFHTNET
jgi:hypothetical protein